MKKIFTLIFCLFVAGYHSNVSGNINPATLGTAYVDNPRGLLYTLNDLAPQTKAWYYPWNWFYNGKIDNQIYGVGADIINCQAEITRAAHMAKNIETVRAGNDSWLLWLSNWRRYGRWFNPWSGTEAVKAMNPHNYGSTNPYQQQLTQKLERLKTEETGWLEAKQAVKEAYNEAWYHEYDLDRIYHNGPQTDNDRTTLKILHERLEAIKDSVTTALINNQDPAFNERMKELAPALGDQDRYKDQYSKVWWEMWLGKRALNVQQLIPFGISTIRNMFRPLPGSNTRLWPLAGLAYVAGASGLTYWLTKKYGKKGLAGSLAVIASWALIANSFCHAKPFKP